MFAGFSIEKCAEEISSRNLLFVMPQMTDRSCRLVAMLRSARCSALEKPLNVRGCKHKAKYSVFPGLIVIMIIYCTTRLHCSLG